MLEYYKPPKSDMVTAKNRLAKFGGLVETDSRGNPNFSLNKETRAKVLSMLKTMAGKKETDGCKAQYREIRKIVRELFAVERAIARPALKYGIFMDACMAVTAGAAIISAPQEYADGMKKIIGTAVVIALGAGSFFLRRFWLSEARFNFVEALERTVEKLDIR